MYVVYRYMQKRIIIILIGVVIVAGIFFLLQKKYSPQMQIIPQTIEGKNISGSFDRSKFRTDAQWKKILTSAQYSILRQAGTEIPFTGKLEYEKRKGTYYSVGCGEPL